jgi:spore germination protein KB
VKVLKEEKITSAQVIMLVAGYFIGSFIVTNTISSTGADAWFAVLVSIVQALILTCITATIAMLNQGRSLVEILVCCFGKTGGKIISVIYLLFTVYLTAAILTSISNYSNTVNYPETPILFISICYMIVIAFAVNIGLEVMGRISEVLILLVIIISFIALISLVTNFHPDSILPLFKYGIAKPTIAGLKNGLFPFAEIFYALNILPNLNDKKKTFSTLCLTTLVAGGVLFLFTVRNLSVLGVNMAERNVFPSEKVFRLMPSIDITPLLDINVIILGIIRVSFILYSEAKIIGDIFGLKDFKIFVLPLAAFEIAVSSSLLRTIFIEFYVVDNIYPLIYIPIFVVLPIIVMIISLIKKKKPKAEPPLLE